MRSIRNKVHQLEAALVENDIDVLCLSEHWLLEEEATSLSVDGYNIVSYTCRTNYKGGGTVILVKKSINSENVLNLNNFIVEGCIEVCAVFLKDFNMYVVCLYRSPSGRLATFLTALEGIICQIGHQKHIVLMGDFNVSFGIGSELGDADSLEVIGLLRCYGFIRLISEPTRGASCLDNAFVNFSIHNFSAQVVEYSISDHRGQLIGSVISQQSRVEVFKCVHRPITQSGINEFFGIISNLTWDFIQNGEMSADNRFNAFLSILSDAFLHSFPEVTFTKRSDQPNKVSWFSGDLGRMRETLMFVSEVCRKYDRENDWIYYKSLKRDYKHAIKEAKRVSNDRAINTSKNPTKSMWNIINAKRKNECKELKCSISPEEFNAFFTGIAEKLLKDLPMSNCDPLIHLKGLNINCDNFSFKEVSFNDVREIIDNLKTKKSCDIYGLSVQTILSIKNQIVIPLTKLINICISEHTFPSCLKKAVVTPVFKKGDKNTVDNYRPISLLPIISKIFEKVISKQIINFFETNSLFSKCQFGFRQGKNTIHAVLELVQNIMDGYEERLYLSALFCDLSKAFDCMSHELLLQKLKYYKFDSNSIGLISSYLQDRWQVVKVNGQASTPESIKVGVPQGSVLGPVLFLIFINDLPFESQTKNFVLFADDTTVFTTGKSEADAHASLKEAKQQVESWFLSNGLLLNREKTQEMTFTLRNTVFSARTSPVKFLGVLLDETLKWDAHVESVCKRLGSSVFVLRNLCGCVSDATLRTAYFGIFHSVMAYGVLVWGGSAHSRRIFGFQRRAVRVLSGLGYREDCRGAFIRLGILTLPSLYILENLLYIKQHNNSLRHQDVHQHNTRNCANFVPMYSRLERCRSRPEAIAVRLLNKLPVSIKEKPVNAFKCYVKKFLLQRAFYSVDEFLNCQF